MPPSNSSGVFGTNTFQNYNFSNNNSNIINNPKIYIPTKFRNRNFNFKKEEQNNAKNKFDNMNKKICKILKKKEK